MVFNKGEIRRVGIEVFNNIKQDFIIDTADYELFNERGDLLDSGLLTINGHVLTTLFFANESGKYRFSFRYTIGVERLIDNIYIQVN